MLRRFIDPAQDDVKLEDVGVRYFFSLAVFLLLDCLDPANGAPSVQPPAAAW